MHRVFPVCLITLKGQGLNETQLRDLGQYDVRNQVANVPGASVPQPFGGRYRQIMVYVDPAETRSAPIERDGCGSRGKRQQPDFAGRRRADRQRRLQPLHQQPTSAPPRKSTLLPLKTRTAHPSGRGRREAPRMPSKFRPTSCASTDSVRCTCRS